MTPCVTRSCTGPAIDLRPEKSVFPYRTVQWKYVERQRQSICCSLFQLVFFLSASVTPILRWKVGCLHPLCTVCLFLSLANVLTTGRPNIISHTDISQTASVWLNSSTLMASRSCTHKRRITCSLMKLHPVSLESWTKCLSNQHVEDRREFVLGI